MLQIRIYKNVFLHSLMVRSPCLCKHWFWGRGFKSHPELNSVWAHGTLNGVWTYLTSVLWWANWNTLDIPEWIYIYRGMCQISSLLIHYHTAVITNSVECNGMGTLDNDSIRLYPLPLGTAVSCNRWMVYHEFFHTMVTQAIKQRQRQKMYHKN